MVYLKKGVDLLSKLGTIETIVLMKVIRNTDVSNPKFYAMAIKGESQRRQNFSSATKPYGQKNDRPQRH